MTERVDLANIALNLLGEDQITSLEDDSRAAKTIKLHYQLARDATLEAYEWSFAQERFIPAPLNDPPAWGYDYAFPVPSNILKVNQVDRNWRQRAILNDNRQRRNSIDHVVENRLILCDRDEVFCRGTRRVLDEGIYSALFSEAFAAKLAVMSCMAITDSSTKLAYVTQLYQTSIEEASSRDAQQSSTRAIIHGGFRRAR